ncbi:GNAT family N-acetyltransferase [Nocardioides sp. BGMRC 2183]|nr:GNAT family N-acetyltransferase [Nocardioides sp. BGMRC 2183]
MGERIEISGVVRRAGRSDIAQLVALRAEMFASMGVEETDPGWRERATSWFEDRLDDERAAVVVVAEGERVVACAMGTIRDAAPSPAVPEGRDVLVSNIVTVRDRRGDGFGSAALEAVMAWARSTGVGRAELMATEVGRGLYERAGFVETTFPAMRAVL